MSDGTLPLLRPSKKSLTASAELNKPTRQKFFDRDGALGLSWFCGFSGASFLAKIRAKKKVCYCMPFFVVVRMLTFLGVV